jgi:CheY-like chemotaxis protein
MSTLSLALIWNEDRDLILMTQLLCRERGYMFQHFTDFAGAQKHWYAHPPTVAIIKRSLDTIDDGLAFCRTIRADYQLQGLPLIVGWADMPRQPFEEAYEAGANGCFGRVFDIGGVFTMVERLAQDPTQTQLVDQPVPYRKKI